MDSPGMVEKSSHSVCYFPYKLTTAKALYDYQAAIPEELGFRKGEVLAILSMQEDGWWEAEPARGGRRGLVPSNFMTPC
jgi:hypothetical protein